MIQDHNRSKILEPLGTLTFLCTSVQPEFQISAKLVISLTKNNQIIKTQDLNHVEIYSPVVASSGGDEPVPVLVLLWGVHWGHLLPGHSRRCEGFCVLAPWS